MSDFEDDEEEWRPPTEAEMKVLGKHIANNISYIAFPRNLCLFSMVVLCKHIANIMSYIAFPRNLCLFSIVVLVNTLLKLFLTSLFQETCLIFPPVASGSW